MRTLDTPALRYSSLSRGTEQLMVSLCQENTRNNFGATR